NVWTSQITLGNGSNDVLDLVARCWLRPGGEVLFSEYAFAVYPIAALSCHTTPVAVPARNFGHNLDAMLQAITANTRIIFIANPNNPTGTWVSAEQLDSFLEAVPEHILVVLDEAYTEYVEEERFPNGLERLPQHKNLIVARTFSKMYGLSGLRVGYAISSQKIADVLNRVRQPFNVNSIALAAAEAALGDTEYVEYNRSVNTAGLVQIAEGLQALKLEYIPSVANFIGFDCGRPAGPVFEALLREGVIVRPLAGYGMPNHLRVSIGLAEENERFLTALQKVLNVLQGSHHRPWPNWRLGGSGLKAAGASERNCCGRALTTHPATGAGARLHRQRQQQLSPGGARRRFSASNRARFGHASHLCCHGARPWAQHHHYRWRQRES